MSSARGVGVITAAAACGGVVIDHRVHGSGGYAEEQSRRTEFAEVAEVVLPIGLRNDCHFVTGCLECASDDGSSKRWVVDIGIAREQDDIDIFPAKSLHLLGKRHKVMEV